jgi:hypothetical protein
VFAIVGGPARRFKALLWAAVVNLILFGLFLTCATSVYETNDDLMMQRIASGFHTGHPDEHLVFTNVLIGWALRFSARPPPIGRQKGAVRWMALNSSSRQLLEEMRAERAKESSDKTVMQVFECQKSIDRAAKPVGAKRITHHDLRHLFATRGIEAGVDIPTVSRWLGHQNGGALCMKTYGHLRDEHSLNEAQKVSF